MPAAALRTDARRGVEVVAVRTTIGSLDEKPLDTHDVYLRLHLLSHRLVQPHGQSLDGIFGLLANVAWTSIGPVPVDSVERARLAVRAEGGQLAVYGIDKFPRMTDYVVPSGVRIAHADRVRLGAYLASGTTVMHEGFVNFNGGTLGTSMVEGRISSRRGGRRPQRHRRRRLDHGHPLRRRQAGRLGGRALPAGRQRGHRHLAGQRLRGR